MLKLKEAKQKGDNNKIISSLIELRKMSKSSEIDMSTFEILLELIKTPNSKIIDYSLSIIANCCLNNKYRVKFKEMGGVPHLLLIVRTIENDSITCRASRLIGNLSMNSDLAKELCNNNATLTLLQLLEKPEKISSDSMKMIFRAVQKLWTFAEFKWKMLPEDLLNVFSKCLNSDDTQVVQLTLETLSLFTHFKSIQRNGKFKISKELFSKLIELTEKESFNHITVSCISNMICYQTLNIWSYLEGSNIAEMYIKYIQQVDNIDGVILKAFHKLCTEGGIRHKVRVAGLLSRLVDLCNPNNVKNLLPIFYLFQFDLDSMMVCSQNPKFISILISNITSPSAVPLLAVLSRLDPPVKELVSYENLDILIKNKDCHGILKNITRNTQFLKPLLMSGKIWEIEKAGCSMEDIGNIGHTESLIIHLLSSGEKKCKEDVSLAVPFLVKPRNFELLYKLVAHYQVITTILNLLQENPVEEKILASIIRLINIFKHNYHKSANFFQDFVDPGDTLMTASFCLQKNLEFNKDEEISNAVSSQTNSHSEIVTFELDNGSCVDINKNLFCINSPVLDSMLNGHFMEAGQKKVRLRRCSKEALLYLTQLLNGDFTLSDIKTETYLELLSLTDRFLLTTLNNTLTENMIIDRTSCPLVYQWYRKAGYTKNNAVIGQKTYEFLFSSSEYLVLAMKNESCRASLVREISQYLSNSLVDLL